MPFDLLFGTAKFSGIDNVTDPISLEPDGRRCWFTVGLNIDLNDEFKIRRRKGYESKISGSFHSLWSRKDLCFAVKDGSLVSIDEDYSTTSIIPVMDREAKVSYWYQAGRVYLTNGLRIGYVRDGIFHTFSGVDQEHKRVMPAGHLLCFYKGRMIVARENLLIISDAMDPSHYDDRTGLRMLPGRVTMLLPVLDGVYLSYNKKTYFAAGPDFLNAQRVEKAGSEAIEGSGIIVESEEFGEEEIGTVAMWSSTEGVFVGGPGGRLRNQTWNHYNLDDAALGAAIYREDLPYGQYLMTYEMPSEDVEADAGLIIPALVVQATGITS